MQRCDTSGYSWRLQSFVLMWRSWRYPDFADFQNVQMAWGGSKTVRDRLVGALLTLFLGQAGRFRWLFLSVNLADMRGHFPRSREAECPFQKIF